MFNKQAESDYSERPAPSTSCIVDFIRCAIVVPTCKDFLDALTKLTKVIESKKTALKEVVRMKNSLASNEEKRVKEGVYRYGDVKMNILVVGGRGKGMICEVQFLLEFMKEAKGLGHNLYEVSRREQFVDDVSSSLLRSFDKQGALFTAASRGDTREFVQIVGKFTSSSFYLFYLAFLRKTKVDFGSEVDLMATEKSQDGYNLAHR